MRLVINSHHPKAKNEIQESPEAIFLCSWTLDSFFTPFTVHGNTKNCMRNKILNESVSSADHHHTAVYRLLDVDPWTYNVQRGASNTIFIATNNLLEYFLFILLANKQIVKFHYQISVLCLIFSECSFFRWMTASYIIY